MKADLKTAQCSMFIEQMEEKGKKEKQRE